MTETQMKYPWETSFYDPDLFDCGAGNADPDDAVDYYKGFLESVSPRRVLDVGCGTGRVTFELVDMGLRVHALDSSETMLTRFREKLATVGRLREQVTCELGNILDENCLSGQDPFCAAIAVDDFLTHFLDPDQLRQCLQNVSRALRPGGVLITDLRGRDKDRMSKAGSTYPKTAFCYPIVGPCLHDCQQTYVTMCEYEDYCESTNIVTSIQRFEYMDMTGRVVSSVYKTIRQRLYPVEELLEYAAKERLESTSVCGRRDLNVGPSREDGAILILRKV